MLLALPIVPLLQMIVSLAMNYKDVSGVLIPRPVQMKTLLPVRDNLNVQNVKNTSIAILVLMKMVAVGVKDLVLPTALLAVPLEHNQLLV